MSGGGSGGGGYDERELLADAMRLIREIAALREEGREVRAAEAAHAQRENVIKARLDELMALDDAGLRARYAPRVGGSRFYRYPADDPVEYEAVPAAGAGALGRVARGVAVAETGDGLGGPVLCVIEGCMRPAYKEPHGYTHRYCGRTHADLAANGYFAGGLSTLTCAFPGCTRAAYIPDDPRRTVYLYCGKTHARLAAAEDALRAANGAGPMATAGASNGAGTGRAHPSFSPPETWTRHAGQ